MNKLNKLGSVAICLLAITLNMSAQTTSWPAVKTEAKPWARWWWLGSAVDKANLTYNMSEYAAKGMGGLEITPIYGVQGNDANNISYLSPKWMEMLTHTENEAARLGMKIDMNTGTGWPFGSSEVTIEDAACKVVFQDYILKNRRDTEGTSDDKRYKTAGSVKTVALDGFFLLTERNSI